MAALSKVTFEKSIRLTNKQSGSLDLLNYIVFYCIYSSSAFYEWLLIKGTVSRRDEYNCLFSLIFTGSITNRTLSVN